MKKELTRIQTEISNVINEIDSLISSGKKEFRKDDVFFALDSMLVDVEHQHER